MAPVSGEPVIDRLPDDDITEPRLPVVIATWIPGVPPVVCTNDSIVMQMRWVHVKDSCAPISKGSPVSTLNDLRYLCRLPITVGISRHCSRQL